MTDTRRIEGVTGAEVGTDWIKLNFQNHDITIDKLNIYNQPVSSLITTIESLQKQNGNIKESWDEQKEEIRSMRHALSMANEKNGGDYYAWMPFEENHLETLSCPVLIEADWIRQLIDLETKPLREQVESQKEEIAAWERSEETLKHAFHVRKNINEKQLYDKDKEIEGYKAITELAVKGLKEVASGKDWSHIMAQKAKVILEKIERLSHE